LGDEGTLRGKDGRIFAEYHGYLSPSGMYMLIKGDYKYCYYPKEEGELYNLKDDPNELNNLAGNQKYEIIEEDMNREINKIVDINNVELEVSRYNMRRKAVYAGISESKIIQEDMEEYIKYFRNSRNEKWWDGGKYMAQETERNNRQNENLMNTNNYSSFAVRFPA